MLQLLWKIENMRSEIEVLALDDDFQDMETDEVALKMSATTPHRTRPSRPGAGTDDHDQCAMLIGPSHEADGRRAHHGAADYAGG